MQDWKSNSNPNSCKIFMISHLHTCLKSTRFLLKPSVSWILVNATSSICSDALPRHQLDSYQQVNCVDSIGQSDINIIIAKVLSGSSENEIFQSLVQDHACNAVQLSQNLVHKLLHRFKDDWKSALGVFKWAGTCPGYEHTSEMYDLVVDILGKMKQMERMRALLEEMNKEHVVTLNTIAKVMRRFAGAGQWEDAVRIFDELGTYGLKKNTESMNLLLDTLCKEHKVEQARAVFLKLRLHISPDAHTFNIFIHGWCKVNRVDEAHWTMQEMKGHGFSPCVISYSTIIRFYCRLHNFNKVYELLDEMHAQGCVPNIVTYTTTMSSLAKSEQFEEAISIAKRMLSTGCKPDTQFYNSFIYTLGRAGRVGEAIYVFEKEMPHNGVAPNTSTYNTLIAMFCNHNQEGKAFDLLQEIQHSIYCKPDVQTFYPLLKSCFRSGRIDNTLRELLDDMVSKHHLSLDLSTYSLLIHGLCKVKKSHWAYLLFEDMIDQGITPKYQTCCLILDEVKQMKMYDAAEKIEDVMKKL